MNPVIDKSLQTVLIAILLVIAECYLVVSNVSSVHDADKLFLTIAGFFFGAHSKT
jgi:hypothetical protein